MDFFTLVTEVGFPIAAAIAAGYFVFLTLKFILAGVSSSVRSMATIITQLDTRVAHMNNDVIKIDTAVSGALGLNLDMNRVSRIEKRTTHRD